MIMLKRFAMAAGVAVSLVGGFAAQSGAAHAAIVEPPAPGYHAQRPYTGNCLRRPAGTVCVRFSDGYVELVHDSITGWDTIQQWGVDTQIAHGIDADYYHILGTNLVETVAH
jgi:hypothetical protein